MAMVHTSGNCDVVRLSASSGERMSGEWEYVVRETTINGYVRLELNCVHSSSGCLDLSSRSQK